MTLNYDMNLTFSCDNTNITFDEINDFKKLLGIERIFLPLDINRILDKYHQIVEIKNKSYFTETCSSFVVKKRIKKFLSYFIPFGILNENIKIFIYEKLNNNSDFVVRILFKESLEDDIINFLVIKIGDSRNRQGIFNFLSNKFLKDIEVLNVSFKIHSYYYLKSSLNCTI